MRDSEALSSARKKAKISLELSVHGINVSYCRTTGMCQPLSYGSIKIDRI